MSRKVFVSNIPVRACVDGWVEVPDGTPPEDLQAALAEALKKGQYEPQTSSVEITLDTQVDQSLVGVWEFCTPLEKA
jgi:hypothetical protein